MIDLTIYQETCAGCGCYMGKRFPDEFPDEWKFCCYCLDMFLAYIGQKPKHFFKNNGFKIEGKTYNDCFSIHTVFGDGYYKRMEKTNNKIIKKLLKIFGLNEKNKT